MEQKIGQTFNCGLSIIKVVKSERDRVLNFCDNKCIFLIDEFCCKPDIAGLCMANDRSDNTDVMFASIGNVKQKSRKVKNRR